ncbi:MAG: sialate O-acetylesterase [Bacteroidota bacterium]
MKKFILARGFALLLLLCFTTSVNAAVVIGPPFTDHAVLQRKMPCPVWGTANAGEQITITFNGQTKTVKAGDDGKWRIVLSPMKAAGPLDMTIAGTNTITLTDIYVGEVWQCAGQSNMDLTLNNTSQFKDRFIDTIKNANLPLMRYMNMRPPRNTTAAWQVISPATAGGCSATGFFFGKEILKSVDCAVGLMVTAVGGTLIETWFDQATVAADPAMKTTKNIAAGSNYNKYVAPVVGFGIRGTVWIQGEQNTYDTVMTPRYEGQFKLLINGWRKAWGQGDFPFYYGQLSSERPNKPIPLDTLAFIPMVREAQRQALTLPNMAMTVNFDLRAGGWHYPQKPEAGYRLSLPAKAMLYGQKGLEYSGPAFKSAGVKNGKVILKFTHIGSGLMAKDGSLKGFVIAGADNKWVAADAVINGKQVEVSSAAVTQPTQVRYAWADRPVGNLYNNEGLPTSPFRSDKPL